MAEVEVPAAIVTLAAETFDVLSPDVVSKLMLATAPLVLATRDMRPY